jgi:hypothetical protein
MWQFYVRLVDGIGTQKWSPMTNLNSWLISYDTCIWVAGVQLFRSTMLNQSDGVTGSVTSAGHWLL